MWNPPGSQSSPAGVVLIQVSGCGAEGDIGRRIVVAGTGDIGAGHRGVNGRLGYGAKWRERRKSDQASQRVDVTDQDRRLAQIYQALAMPVLKNFVDALPTASGHVAEFSLGDVKLH